MPHSKQPVLTAGPPPGECRCAVVLLHGRGASAEDVLSLYERLDLPRLAAVAPQAARGTWYPNTFLAPLESNQPYLDSALALVSSILSDLEAHGVGAERTAILGFSQGACLTAEYALRHPRRYGAILVLTGGLIGSSVGTYTGSLDGTPVFLGCSDPDPYIPLARVLETQAVLQRLGARVDYRSYPGMPHTVNQEEIAACRDLLEPLCR